MIKHKDSYPVDTGHIAVWDYATVLKLGGKIKDKNLNKTVALEKGLYKITVHIPDCWLGKVNKTFALRTEGTFVIGDSCYLFEDKLWQALLNDTDYLEFLPRGKKIGTGGDGQFSVNITFEKLSEMEEMLCWSGKTVTIETLKTQFIQTISKIKPDKKLELDFVVEDVLERLQYKVCNFIERIYEKDLFGKEENND